MQTLRSLLSGMSTLAIALAVQGQNDGDHCITDGSGTTYLATDAQATAAPLNVTIGTAPTTDATLQVRGDQLPIADPLPPQAGSLGTFRTDVASRTLSAVA